MSHKPLAFRLEVYENQRHKEILYIAIVVVNANGKCNAMVDMTLNDL